MPASTHSIELNVAINDIWDFVRDMSNWAPLVPGYINHEIIDKSESLWTVKGDFGIVQKTVQLQVTITKWDEPTKISFDLKGINEDLLGDGYFQTELITDKQSIIIGHLRLEAQGVMGMIINSILSDFVPYITKKLTESVGNKIKMINSSEQY